VVPVTSSPAHQTHLARWRAEFGQELDNIKARGVNCRHCKSTGIGGRTVIAEVVWVDEIARQFIQKSDTLGWDKHLREQGWPNYKDQALRLLREGVCDPLDIERMVGEIG